MFNYSLYFAEYMQKYCQSKIPILKRSIWYLHYVVQWIWNQHFVTLKYIWHIHLRLRF